MVYLSVFATILYMLVSLGVGIEYYANNARPDLSLVIGTLWPVAVGMLIADRHLPIERRHYEQAHLPFGKE